MHAIKYLSVTLLFGIVGGFVVLGIVYFFKATTVVERIGPKGARAYGGFFQQSEADVLGVQDPPSNGAYEMRVYLFHEDKFNSVASKDYSSPVERTTRRRDVATYAVEQIVRGPTVEELESGYRPTFGPGAIAQMSDDSQCGTKQFLVSLDPEQYFAQVTFCKPITTDQTWGYAFITEQIRDTLIQFDRIHKVKIVTPSNTCINGTPIREVDDCIY